MGRLRGTHEVRLAGRRVHRLTRNAQAANRGRSGSLTIWRHMPHTDLMTAVVHGLGLRGKKFLYHLCGRK